MKRARRHLSADSGQQTALRRLLAERSEDTLTGQFCKNYNRFVSFILKEMAEVKKLERAFGIYAGVIKPKGVREKLHAKIVREALEKGAEKFGASPDMIIFSRIPICGRVLQG